MANSPASDPAKAVIPDHTLGGGILPVIHTRYLIDAAAVAVGVGLFAISLFIISEPDIASTVRKLASSGVGAAKEAAVAAAV